MPYSKFSEQLFNVAKSWAGKWTKLAKERLVSSPLIEPGGPKPLTNIIEVHTKVERKSAQRFSLVLTAKGKGAHVAEYGHAADLARAYELGSGEQATFGGTKYPITPRPPKKYLVFKWDRADETIPRVRSGERAGQVVLKKVMHPGVEAANQGQGYARTSMNRLLADGRHELTETGKKAILADLNFAFKGGRKK